MGLKAVGFPRKSPEIMSHLRGDGLTIVVS